MAVELAKVSLWLDAFTLGAPLSFLDHHLKHGNGLIGARIEEVRDYLRGGEGPVQIDMFSGSEFAGVMLATDLMRQVSYLSDNTVAQIRQSADQFRQANDHLAPFKRLLDVYPSRYFGNDSNGTKKTKADEVRLFLKDAQTKDWLNDPQNAKLDDSLIRSSTIAETALNATRKKRFFHWELEFPEVFFAPSKPGGQDVQLRKDGGFDVVVGNPPWGLDFDNEEKNFFRIQYSRIHVRTPGSYNYFVNRMYDVSGNATETVGVIVPNTILTQHEFWKTRKFLHQIVKVSHIVNLGDGVFESVTTPSCILVFVGQNTTVNTKYIDLRQYRRHNLENTLYIMEKILKSLRWLYFKKSMSLNQKIR
jgi:hypothetical protein